LVEKIEEYSI